MTEGGPDHFALASHKIGMSVRVRSFKGVMSQPTNPGMYACMYASVGVCEVRSQSCYEDVYIDSQSSRLSQSCCEDVYIDSQSSLLCPLPG